MDLSFLCYQSIELSSGHKYVFNEVGSCNVVSIQTCLYHYGVCRSLVLLQCMHNRQGGLSKPNFNFAVNFFPGFLAI